MKQCKTLLAGLLLLGAILGTSLLATQPSHAQSAAEGSKCNARLLTFPAWYNGLRCMTDSGGKSNIKVGGNDGTPLENAIWIIGLNVVEILIQLVGYVSLAFIIFGGYKYMLSNGSVDGNEKGRKTILNAVIGLVISLASVAIVNTIVANL